jgi:glycosyltransferase involved in cell wall biosynthesis
MPARNAASYIDVCIESIINQTFTEWELIVVNDHSEDNTLKQLENWAKKDNRIFIFNNDGSGILPALNLAIQKSKGTYISRMDADDYMHPEKIGELLSGLDLNPQSSISVGMVEYFSEEELGQGFRSYAKWLNSLVVRESHWNEIYKECVIPSPCWLMAKNDLLEIGGFSDAIYPEDYDMCFRLYRKGIKIAGVKKVLHYWRDHKERSSRNLAVYQDPWFLKIKIKYFIEIEMAKENQVVVWGAGKKGKIVVRMLLNNGKDVHWLSNNEKKWGKDIYGKTIMQEKAIENFLDYKIIIAVGNKIEKADIDIFLVSKGLIQGINYFMFS